MPSFLISEAPAKVTLDPALLPLRSSMAWYPPLFGAAMIECPRASSSARTEAHTPASSVVDPPSCITLPVGCELPVW